VMHDQLPDLGRSIGGTSRLWVNGGGLLRNVSIEVLSVRFAKCPNFCRGFVLFPCPSVKILV